MRGTVIGQTGPVLYTVKVNGQTWNRHVEQLRDSNICPSATEVRNDGAVPEEVEHGVSAVVGSEWKDVPPLAVTPTREGQPLSLKVSDRFQNLS